MKIRSMRLENYRCFRKLSIDFDDRLTVLVGVNGAGKTSVLDALSIFLRLSGEHITGSYTVHKVPVSDISFEGRQEGFAFQLGVVPTINGKASDEIVLVSMAQEQVKQGVKIVNHRMPTESFRQALEAEKPVFVAYMAGRIIDEKASVLKQKPQSASIASAYASNFTRTIDFSSTLSWFDKADADEARHMRDSGERVEMPELRAVREALSKALLGRYERPTMRGNPPELLIYEKGTNHEYKISQISDGYRAMLALVMDLARRMAQSRGNGRENDTKGTLLQTPAVVLIDEVELHLHPSWQQTVLTTLLDIFPNTQFIVTTHSPHVLTSIPPKHLRILSDGKAYTFSEQTEGAEASRLLKGVFGVEQRPANLEIVRTLKEYSELVYAEQWDTPRAEELKKVLVNHYGNDDPELMMLDMHIDNRKWERGL